MQSILFPMTNMRITQKYGVGTHLYGYPIDSAGKDTGIENAIAPFDGVVKKVWANGNSVWIESLSQVRFADGSVDFAVVMFTHDNNVSDLPVGKKVSQGEVVYQEGTNNASGNHIHIEIGKGKFTGTGWYQAKNGQWVINNAYKPEKAFFLKDVNVIDGAGLLWVQYIYSVDQVLSVGSKIQFSKEYRVDELLNTGKYGWQVRTNELCPKGFNWSDNGIPVAPLTEVGQGSPSNPIDQKLLVGSYYTIAGTYEVLDLGQYLDRWLAKINLGGLFVWVDVATLTEV